MYDARFRANAQEFSIRNLRDYGILVPEPERTPGQPDPPRRFFRKPPLKNTRNSG